MIKIEPEGHKFIIGIISDTHGFLPQNARKALLICDLIIHVGDIDTPDVLNALRTIAPTIAVRGNMDRGDWARQLAENEIIQIGPTNLYVRHIVDMRQEPPKNTQAVIYGHTHLPDASKRNGVLYINPGSASAPRHGSPPSVAILHWQDGDMEITHYSLPEPLL